MLRRLLHHRVSIWFILTCVAIGWAGRFAYRRAHHLASSYASVSESHQALERLESLQSLLESAESSVNAYVITGDKSRLASFLQADSVASSRLRRLESLVADHSSQVESFQELERLTLGHLSYLRNVVRVRRTKGVAVAAQWIATEAKGSPRELIQKLLADLKRKERNEVQLRSLSFSDLWSRVHGALVAAAVMVLVFFAWALGLLRWESHERRLAERDRRRMESFLYSIIERIPYMVLVKEARSLRLTLVNKAAAKWFGRPEEELLGKKAMGWSGPQEADEDPSAKAPLPDGQSVNIEERVLISGEERILHTQEVAVPDPGGVPAFRVTISEDITERKRAERMLQLSRDAAMESARLKAEFLRNMSHEFRTPLSVIQGVSSLLESTELADEQRRMIRTVQQSVDGLARLAKDILDFSKIESGVFVLERSEIIVRSLVDGVLRMFSEQARVKGVRLSATVADDVPASLWGDGSRLRQVLTQLIGNAVKFTPSGDISVSIQREKEDDLQFWLRCRVVDTGMGIDDETQQHLFEAFRQGDGSRTRRFGGAGVGLAVARRIVELMGGMIDFKSTLGQGSDFWFMVPLRKEPLVSSDPESPGLPVGRSRALIVDENETVRQLLCQQLSLWALAGESVPSGAAALAALQRAQESGHPFSVVLTDLHLPDMDGTALARAIKADPALRDTPLVVMTSGDAPIDMPTATSLGFSRWMPKPPDPEALYECLSCLIVPSQTNAKT